MALKATDDDARIRGAFNGATTYNQFLSQGPSEPFMVAVLRWCTMCFCFPAAMGSLHANGQSMYSALTAAAGRSAASYSSEPVAALLLLSNARALLDAADAHARQWWSGRTRSATPDALGQQLLWLRLMVASHLDFMSDRNPGGLYLCYRHGTTLPERSTLGVCVAQRPPSDVLYGPEGPLRYMDSVYRAFEERAATAPLQEQCALMLEALLQQCEPLAQRVVGGKAEPSLREPDKSLRYGLTPMDLRRPRVDEAGFLALCSLWTQPLGEGLLSGAQAVQQLLGGTVKDARRDFFLGRAPHEPITCGELHVQDMLSRLRNHQIAPSMQRSRPTFTDPLHNGIIARICDWLDTLPVELRAYYPLTPDNRDMADIGANLTTAQRVHYGFVVATAAEIEAARAEGARAPGGRKNLGGGAESQAKRRRPPSVQQQTLDSMFAAAAASPALTPGQALLAVQSPVETRHAVDRKAARDAHRALLLSAVRSTPVFGQAMALRALYTFVQTGSPFVAFADRAQLADVLRRMVPVAQAERLVGPLGSELCSVVSLQKLLYTPHSEAYRHVGTTPLDTTHGAPLSGDAHRATLGMVDTPEVLALMVSEPRHRRKPRVVMRALLGCEPRKWHDVRVLRDLLSTLWSEDPQSQGRRILSGLWPAMLDACRDLGRVWLEQWQLMTDPADTERRYSDADIEYMIEQLATKVVRVPPPVAVSLSSSGQWSPPVSASGSPVDSPRPRPDLDVQCVPRPTSRAPMRVMHLTAHSLAADDDSGLFPVQYL